MTDEIRFWSRDRRTAWLSSFALSPFDAEGRRVLSVEHFYQAGKTADPDLRRHILLAKTPGEAKRRGRHFPTGLAVTEPWPEVERFRRMAQGLCLRYRAWPQHHARLVATGSAALIHVTPWPGGDSFWGDGENGGGLNLFGELQMIFREQDAGNLDETAAVAALTDVWADRLL